MVNFRRYAVLYYGFEVCPLTKYDWIFTVLYTEELFQQHFSDTYDDAIAECMDMFNCLYNLSVVDAAFEQIKLQ